MNADLIFLQAIAVPARCRIALLLMSIACVQGQEVSQEKFHGRNAWVLSNGLIRVSLLSGGGHIAEVRLISGDPIQSINPMRVPHYETIEPQTYDPVRHDSLYGTGSHRYLSSGYMGHLLCFPHYGPPSGEETAAGLGNHGEAPIVEWRQEKVERGDGFLTFHYGAELRRTQYRVQRAVTIWSGKRHVRVEEWVENTTAFDRPINWMQHATFGNPFVEPGKTYLDTSGTRGLTAGGDPATRSLKPDSELHWPEGTGWQGEKVNLRPMQTRTRGGTYYVLRMDPDRRDQFFTMYHKDYRVLIGYSFPAEDNPWLADWQENRSNTFAPWNSQAVARGIEFGSTPFAEGLRKSVERGSLFGVAAFRWIGARQRLKTEYTIFVQEIPAGFAGVKDVRMENGVPAVVAR
jgi:hypothetical protein